MNPYRRLMVHVGDDDHDDALLGFAARLAARHGAALLAVHAIAPLSLGAYLTPEAAMTAAEATQQLVRDRAARLRDRVRRASRVAGLGIETLSPVGDPLKVLMAQSRLVDLAVVAAPGASDHDAITAGFASRLLIGAGCPLLFVPPATAQAGCGTRVLVAWSGTRESARALRDALPALRAAEYVEMLRFGPERAAGAEPLDAVAAYLAAHGVQARCTTRAVRDVPFAERMLSPSVVDASVAELLLSHAADTNADLIVMGGYGHSRAYELVLGGVTRSMLGSMTVPVMMSH